MTEDIVEKSLFQLMWLIAIWLHFLAYNWQVQQTNDKNKTIW